MDTDIHKHMMHLQVPVTNTEVIATCVSNRDPQNRDQTLLCFAGVKTLYDCAFL